MCTCTWPLHCDGEITNYRLDESRPLVCFAQSLPQPFWSLLFVAHDYDHFVILVSRELNYNLAWIPRIELLGYLYKKGGKTCQERDPPGLVMNLAGLFKVNYHSLSHNSPQLQLAA